MRLQLACARRELALRTRVYPRLVAKGTMLPEAAEHELAAMTAIVRTLARRGGGVWGDRERQGDAHMSLDMMAQVWRLRMPPKEKFILMAYADEFDQWPPRVIPIGQIAYKTGYTEDEVKESMYKLMADDRLLHDSHGL